MYRRIIVNIILAFALISGFFLARDYIRIEIIGDKGNPRTFSQEVGMQPWFYMLQAPFIFLILILIPYNFLLVKYNYARSKPLQMKIVILILIFVVLLCCLSFFTNVLFYPYWRNLYYLITFSFMATISATVIHYLVDKKDVENQG